MVSYSKPKNSAGSIIFDAAFVLFAALTIQFLYVRSAAPAITLESVRALRGALEVIDAERVVILDAHFAPGYSLFIASILQIAGKSIGPVLAAQHLLVALLASLATVVSRVYAKRSFSLCAGFLIALDPLSAFVASWISPECLFVFLISAAAMAAFEAHRSPLSSALSGLLFGSASLVLPEGAVLWAAAFLLVFTASLIRRDDLKQTCAALVLFTLSFLLLLVPWMMYRYMTLGKIGIADNTAVEVTLEKDYLEQSLLSFAELLHLKSDSHKLPQMADNYLGGKLSADDLLKRAKATQAEKDILLSYQPKSTAAESWRAVIHDIHNYKVICSMFLLFLVFVSIYALARGSLFDPIFLLPYLIFTTLAAHHAYFLETDERLTLVIAPLLFLQLALLLGAVDVLAKTRR